ncbi:aminoglycoside 3-N-acetyltransferase [Streptomyces sp. TLI_55]|uniref:aminoglycoside N(3)-acetyltransferase n=1 Tax=Streptomyces sp. TLI_55 TaxID=1938861 RepID=UPI000BD49D81|nr:AAC(3) family N-acetyltransferase [Streptomyces sp. TLI_55]SNX65177.1 aminoglycoside 3-N-acetyltransferase [Streptomyces sp. TLI_55]
MTATTALVEELMALGLLAGTVLLVHAACSRVGTAPDKVLAALLQALGPDGTLVVPTFTAGNSDTSPAYRRCTRGMTERERAAYQDTMPPFDIRRTPSAEMGQLAEAVRRSPGAVRSAHPQTSFAALGPRADELMADHKEACHLGPNSPLGRLELARAQVLLLGVGFDRCTGFHLAEYRLPNQPRREYRCVVQSDGERRWTSFKDVELDDSTFGILGADFEACRGSGPDPAVRKGSVGDADARLFPLAAAVDFATGWLSGIRRSHIPPASSQGAA